MPDAPRFPLLEFRGVDTHYGDLHVLKSVDYRIDEGEIVCLLGGNASGKSTTMKTIMGRRAADVGRGSLTRKVTRRGRRRRAGAPRHCPGARSAPPVSAHDGLREPRDGRLYAPRGPEFEADLERVFTLFPRVKERSKQLAGTLSGGEQQMVAIGRALMARPRLLCMDEPSMGLVAASLSSRSSTSSRRSTARASTIFMVEQNANMALQIAHRAYVLQTGQVVLSGAAAELRENPMIREAYLGEMKVE